MDYSTGQTEAHAVVVGGGLLGLEAAKAVYDLQTVAKVSIVNRQAYPLSRQLDADGGDIVLKRVRALGVDVLTQTTVKDLITTSSADNETEVLTGLKLDSTVGAPSTALSCTIVIFAIGITPRDDIAKAAGIKCYERGGIVVDDFLQTSAPDVYAVGECASWNGQTYGLIGPGSKPSHYLRENPSDEGRFSVEMADILSFNLTQTVSNGNLTFRPRKMNTPDLSTKLKLMGVDVSYCLRF